MWNYTLADVLPYKDFCIEKVLFRKAVLSFLGVSTSDKTNDYCKACKKSRGISLNADDAKCTTCNKNDIKVEQIKKDISNG